MPSPPLSANPKKREWKPKWSDGELHVVHQFLDGHITRSTVDSILCSRTTSAITDKINQEISRKKRLQASITRKNLEARGIMYEPRKTRTLTSTTWSDEELKHLTDFLIGKIKFGALESLIVNRSTTAIIHKGYEHARVLENNGFEVSQYSIHEMSTIYSGIRNRVSMPKDPTSTSKIIEAATSTSRESIREHPERIDMRVGELLLAIQSLRRIVIDSNKIITEQSAQIESIKEQLARIETRSADKPKPAIVFRNFPTHRGK